VVWLDRGLAVAPHLDVLHLVRGEVLIAAGRGTDAYAQLRAAAARGGPGALRLTLLADQIAGVSDVDQAAVNAAAAVAANAADEDALYALCSAQLAQGRAAEAADAAEKLLQLAPLDQHALALQATAWRLLGDPRAANLYDYDAFLGVHRLDTPAGWPSLEAFLAQLARALEALHTTSAHPVGQSVRGGSQTTGNLLHARDPAIRAFFQAVDGPIRRHIAALGNGDDPLRARSLGGYDYAGIWSVRLQPGAGSHVDHVHQAGWLSSACYIDIPPAVGADAREGWLKLGQPGVPTNPPLGPESWVRPEPGRLVLFPSYMWHGVTPFGGDRPRLTVAFDLVPAEGSPAIARGG
jgi:hypothetical protein